MEIHHTDAFSEAFDYASGATGERFQNPLWQLTEVFLGGRFRKSVAIVKSFGSAIVTNAVNSKGGAAVANTVTQSSAALESFNAISGTLINSLLDSISDQKVVADAALNYLSAGENDT
jgi:hypothetical protein